MSLKLNNSQLRVVYPSLADTPVILGILWVFSWNNATGAIIVNYNIISINFLLHCQLALRGKII